MPSPVGHSLIGLAVACGRLLPRGPQGAALKGLWSQRGALMVLLVLANLPDVDYLPGVLMGEINAFHHYYTHTLGWIVAIGLLAWLGWRQIDRRVGWGMFGFMLLALATHLVADELSADSAPPYGIMALWPFTDRFFISPVTVFWDLAKETWADVFQWYNVRAVAFEAAVCLPLVLAVLVWKRRSPRLSEPSASGKMPAEESC